MEWSVLLELELKCSLLLIAAFLVIFAIRRFSSAQRHFVLMLAVCGGLLVPAAHFLLPHWETSILPPSSAGPAPEVLAETAEPAGFPVEFVQTPLVSETELSRASIEPVEMVMPVATPEPPAQAVAPKVEENPSVSIRQIVTFVWLGGAAIMLLSLVIGYLSAWRLVRGAPTAQGAWPDTREHVRGRMAMSRRVALLECSNRLAPMAFGLIRPAIVLPVDGQKWPEQKRSAVLIHELAHVKRNDCLIHLVCTAALALHWFNPLFWIAARCLRLEREHACDDYVLSNGAEAADYADQLLEVARMQSCRVPLLSAALTMARKNALEGRLLAILDGGRRRGAFGLGAVCLAVLLTVGIALPLASATGAKAQVSTDAQTVAEEDNILEESESALVRRPDPEFVAAPQPTLPEMEQENPTVRVRKSAASKSGNRIVALMKMAPMPEISIPELIGTGDEVRKGMEDRDMSALDLSSSRATTPEVLLASSPPSLLVSGVDVPVIASGGATEKPDVNAEPFLGEWIELGNDGSAPLHFLVQFNGQALLEGGDVRTRMQWKLNYDELLLTTSEGVRTANISTEGLLIYRKGGRAMMTFGRPGNTVELPETEERIANSAPNAEEQLQDRLKAAANIRSSSARDGAFSSIALDSAKLGYVESMERAVGQIGSSQTKDRITGSCIDLLLEQGRVKEATALAKDISRSSTRDAALGRIANRETVVEKVDLPETLPFPAATAEMQKQIEARLKVIDRITVVQERDAALMGVAADAARMGSVEIALKALSKMMVLSSKTAAAELCADQFILQGMNDEAVQMAEQIVLLNKRNEVLARIAQGRSAVVETSRSLVDAPVAGQRFGRRLNRERQAEYTRQLEARLAIAEQVTLPSERDEVLAGIAVDAARLGVVEPALKALDGIQFVSDRDAAAVQCADQFILMNLSEYAGQVAEKITFYNTKRAVVERIARGRTVVGGISGGTTGGARPGRRPNTNFQVASVRELEARMNVAEQIKLPTDRDAVLSGIAVDAARLGAIGVALEALDKVQFVSTRDTVAAQCADQFILQGLTAEAGRVAEKITFYSTKREVIDKIARSSSALMGTTEDAALIFGDGSTAPEQDENQQDVMQLETDELMEFDALQGEMEDVGRRMNETSEQMKSMMKSMETP